ncbi:MAG: RNA pseudouridine synthase [Zetaproteobacteria bacterium CG06_land_8_20_14_3_00_59_53]|nr:MAG: RNA pseudouridine synthase [Zetaproteobacteria bacterium CG23_combo_of_CG06-09_8_20_14_all_59_86]PIQ66203.1 MAG: RNA pseudouridine synthase [Zetaproteobacteria bacterium CG11_big_fil_rev_8_21_14_0_20_59_439]PIU70545.1 MAG: RNA pseudouridine synthase [Zetaproteobacteria bacterium CG06_land_8_20_14_3_00_59_53]PIU97964.1 MAG: RNA pseudouridine synthase [Zetaproteobacteria bacterium CG03_land_8_20_14_0_80_59_51]PIY46955.1 MAG: RNA pseudouridine synthase [Zetaproteobacteria bacterium CG_4_10
MKASSPGIKADISCAYRRPQRIQLQRPEPFTFSDCISPTSKQTWQDAISSFSRMDLLSYFPVAPDADDIPAVMPSPFCHTPHPLAEKAVRMLQQRLSISDALSVTGKMYGVLVVRDTDGQIGFLSAFSGMMNGLWQIPGFVPPIFDLAEHDRFLPEGNDELAVLTAQLEGLEASLQDAPFRQQISQLQVQREQSLAAMKQQHQANKAVRRQQRLQLRDMPDTAERESRMAALALASQQQKRQATNAALLWHDKLHAVQVKLDALQQQIMQIKDARSAKSRRLHRRVFESYRLENRLQEKHPITHFFADGTPPAGSGDCAGPKLIHYALQHRMQPLALAEFWWGPSPSTGVRHHGHFYPACRGKCLPILPFMLRGLEVEPEPDYGLGIAADEPQIVFEDDAIVLVNKPAGLMSVPGKYVKDSVFTRLLDRYPQCPELKLIHRLDMGTSGLLLVAKNMQANSFLQRQFIQRRVEKRYEAVLSGVLPADKSEGEIDLPLRIDFDDRPRQMVCYQHGKAARTRWQVIARSNDTVPATTRVWFYPLTGRTHQLRMHAAHPDGLNMAIVGDDLYGSGAERLMLHAQRLCFTHPLTREWIQFEVPTPF